MEGTDIAMMLARAGGAIAEEGSWQQKLSNQAGEMASNEQDRRYLADMLGGETPDPSGRFGLDPEIVLKGLQLRHQIEQSRPKEIPMSTVETPVGTITMPTEDVPQAKLDWYKAKNAAEPTKPTIMRTFRLYQQMDDKEKKEFDEFSKNQRGKSPEEIMGMFLAKREAATRQDKELESELELGTPEHVEDVKSNLEDSHVSKTLVNINKTRAEKGLKPYDSKTLKTMLALNKAAKEIDDARDDVSDVKYERGPEGEGFYGTNKDGERVLIQRYTR